MPRLAVCLPSDLFTSLCATSKKPLDQGNLQPGLAEREEKHPHAARMILCLAVI